MPKKKVSVPTWVPIVAIAFVITLFLVTLNPNARLLSLNPIGGTAPVAACTDKLPNNDYYSPPAPDTERTITVVAKNKEAALKEIRKRIETTACSYKPQPKEEEPTRSADDDAKIDFADICINRSTSEVGCTLDSKTKVKCSPDPGSVNDAMATCSEPKKSTLPVDLKGNFQWTSTCRGLGLRCNNCSGACVESDQLKGVPVSAFVVDLRVKKTGSSSNPIDGAIAVPPNTPITLVWSTKPAKLATTCTASDGWTGDKKPSGTENIGAVTKNTTYTLTCNGNGNTTKDIVTVNITSPTPNPGKLPSDTPIPPRP